MKPLTMCLAKLPLGPVLRTRCPSEGKLKLPAFRFSRVEWLPKRTNGCLLGLEWQIKNMIREEISGQENFQMNEFVSFSEWHPAVCTRWSVQSTQCSLLVGKRCQIISDFYWYTGIRSFRDTTKSKPRLHFQLALNLFFFFGLFAISWATDVAYRGSQARGQIGTVATGLCQSHSNIRIRVTSATYTTAHGNIGSLTHWARPGIEPTTSWFLAGFVNHWGKAVTPSLSWFLRRSISLLFMMQKWSKICFIQ